MSKSSASRKQSYAFYVLPIVAVVAIGLIVLTPAQRWQEHGTSPHSLVSAVSTPKAIVPAAQDRLRASYAALPLAFEQNVGQTDSEVKYMARGSGYNLFLTSSEAIFKLHKRGEFSTVRSMIEHKRLGPAKVKAMSQQRQEMNSTSSHVAVVRMQIQRLYSASQVSAGDMQPGKINYFIGNDLSKWHSNISLFGRVNYRNLYPGVDLVFHGAGRDLEFDYLISPGADAESIAFSFKGADRMRTNAAGDLILATSAGPLEIHKPVAYQEQDGKRMPVEARFRVFGTNEVAFALGPYDHNHELVIDPSVSYIYSTYFGGDAADYGLSIVADANGDAYIAGSTDSDSIPGPSSPASNPNTAGFDAFVTEINPSGAVVFTTIFGGSTGAGTSSPDNFPGFPNALAVDSSGIYVGGTTSTTDFPTTTGVIQPTFGGGTTTIGENDAFAVKLTSNGSSIAWATYFGGSDSDSGLGLAIDANDNAYLVGETYSSNLPVKNPLPSGSELDNGKGTGFDDGYIAVLNSSATAFNLVSYVGGSGGSLAAAVALDTNGNAYISGSTISTDLPVTSGVVQSSLNGSGFDDIFACAISANTFTAANTTSSPTVAAQVNAYRKYSRLPAFIWFPISGLVLFGSFLFSTNTSRRRIASGTILCLALAVFTSMPACGGSSSSNGGGGGGGGGSSANSYTYMTYYGGTNLDESIGIVADSSGDAYVTGQTASTDFPVSSTTFQSTLGGTGAQNAFLLELNPSGSKAIYSSYLGGSGTEFGLGIALDGSGNVYLTGQTSSTNFPLTGETQAVLGGPTDAYVSVLNPSSNLLVFSSYLGGSGDEDQLGGSIAVSPNGNFFVAGDTDSGNGGTSAFPTLNALDPTWGGGSCLNQNNNTVPCPNGYITAYTTVQ